MKVLKLEHVNHSASASIDSYLLAAPTLVALCLISVIGLAVGSPLFDLDEGAFSEATREMLVSGNWVSTYLNGEPRHDKPILIYWFQAISVKLFGLHEISFRLPSLLASFLCLFLAYRFVKESSCEKTAAIFIWIFATFSISTVIFKSATADALLNLWICLTFFEIYRFCMRPRSKQLLLIGTLMGLGFLTKGPVAVVLPLLSSFIALNLHGRARQWLWAIGHPYSWCSLLLVIAPWHIAVYLDQGWAFFEGFYLGHNLNRFAETRESHGGSVFYYLVLIPITLLPFIGTFLSIFRQPKTLLSDFFQTYLAAWFIVVLAIFSFSSTQLPHYILYGMPPVFILLAMRLFSYDQSNSNNSYTANLNRIGATVSVLLFTLSPFALAYADENKMSIYDYEVAIAGFQLFTDKYRITSLSIAAIATAVIWTPWRGISSLSRSLLAAAASLISVNFILLPLIAESRQAPVKEAAQLAKTIDDQIVSWRIAMPSFSVYSQNIIKERTPLHGDTVFTRSSSIPKLNEKFGVQAVSILFNKNGIVLLHIESDR